MTIRVRRGDGGTVAEVLARAGADREAIAEGRVFVGRRRVRREDEPLDQGQVVEVMTPRSVAQSVPILLNEGSLVAVDKPAGIPTIPDPSGAAHSLLNVVAKTLGIDSARLHPTSRLDRGVSGVVVFALTHEAAERLSKARAYGMYERRYVALTTHAPSPPAGTWDSPIGRAHDRRLRAVQGRDPVAASTRYATCASAAGGAALLGCAPRTGRTHQIRVHASHAGVPLLGDREYGGPTRVTLGTGRVLEPGRVALHAARVVVPNAAGARVVISAAIPPELDQLWLALGGDQAAWHLATSAELDP